MFSSKDLFFTPTSGAFTVSKSLRFRSGSTTYLNRTQGSPTNQIKWTWSAWVKLGTLGVDRTLFGAANAGSAPYASIFVTSGDNLRMNASLNGSTSDVDLITTSVYRDPSAWYHIVFIYDSAQGTSTNRCSLYVNGVQVTSFSTSTYPGSSVTTAINTNTYAAAFGRRQNGATWYFDGYLAEVNFVDGSALTPSSFGAYDTNGVWQPITPSVSSYGTNGFYLKFTDVGATSGSNTGYGKDFAGTNYWTTNNFGTTSNLTTYDSMLDSPTNATGDIGNYAVVNPIAHPATFIAPTDGNLSQNCNTSAWTLCVATLQIPDGSGLWQWELVQTGTANGANAFGVALSTVQASVTGDPGSRAGCSGVNNSSGAFINGATSGSITYPTVGNTVTCLYDATNRTFQVFSNGTSQGTITGLPAGDVQPFVAASSSNGSPTFVLNFGQRPFAYDKGGKALNTQNLTTPTITNGAQYMAATLWSGNGTSQTINNGTNTTIGTTFQPDFVWGKLRNTAYNHALTDVVRGATKVLNSDTTAAEQTLTDTITAFNINGFSVGANTYLNGSGYTYVGWQWKAGGTGVTNTSGTITSTVSANTSAGFSVVTATAPASGSFTIGHGLGVTPGMIIVKSTAGGTANWAVWHQSLGSSYYLNLNQSAAQTSTTYWGTMTSSLISFAATNLVNASSAFVCYAFAPVAGYSAFGSYTGNGSADGPFVYTGFRPRYVMVKNATTGGAGYDWYLWDTSRATYNVIGNTLAADLSDAEFSASNLDILSNGFKMRSSSAVVNGSTNTIIYAAFAENPFKISRAR